MSAASEKVEPEVRERETLVYAFRGHTQVTIGRGGLVELVERDAKLSIELDPSEKARLVRGWRDDKDVAAALAQMQWLEEVRDERSE